MRSMQIGRAPSEKSTRVIFKLNHPPDLEKGSKDNRATLIVETDVAKPLAATFKRRHNVLVDTHITTLSGENDVIFALSISNRKLNNSQPLGKVLGLNTISVNSSFFEDVPSSFMLLDKLLVGLEEGVSITPEDSIGSMNGINAFDLPKVDIASSGELQPILKNDHPSLGLLTSI
ncbi:UNVERIFIED_CONTAM: hypothetical protein Sradi_4382700 [Sesamum radiatum]|uniref:Uncharacterized protein n=1 Tax=Sesamum radiatum TaxID=300843 RepID=A0AAW2NP26_SESRA